MSNNICLFLISSNFQCSAAGQSLRDRRGGGFAPPLAANQGARSCRPAAAAAAAAAAAWPRQTAEARGPEDPGGSRTRPAAADRAAAAAAGWPGGGSGAGPANNRRSPGPAPAGRAAEGTAGRRTAPLPFSDVFVRAPGGAACGQARLSRLECNSFQV